MKKNLTILAVALTTIIAGCKKDNSSSADLPPNKLLSLETISNTQGQVLDSMQYRYDDKNRLVEYKHSINNDDYVLTYDNSDHLTAVSYYFKQNLVSITNYNYLNSNVIQNNIYFTNNAVSGISIYTLTVNADQKVIKRDYGSNNYDAYTYDKYGNLSSESFYRSYNNVSSVATTNFQYDGNKSPFSNVAGNYFIFTLDNSKYHWDYKYFANNMTTATAATNTSNASYSFDEYSYPLTASITNTNAAAEVHVYTYIDR